jgi:hypothetical protein
MKARDHIVAVNRVVLEGGDGRKASKSLFTKKLFAKTKRTEQAQELTL